MLMTESVAPSQCSSSFRIALIFSSRVVGIAAISFPSNKTGFMFLLEGAMISPYQKEVWK